MKNLYKGFLYSFFWLNVFFTTAQNYRNPKAYIADFGKSELFVKIALMEYSKSIIEANPDSRVEATMERIFIKLDDLKLNLLKNDKGVFGDTQLRDEFLNLNAKTILLLKNNTLKLNDYAVLCNYSYDDIFSAFSYKEKEIRAYYQDILKYEQFKKEFGLKYKIAIRNYNSKNVFEYNAYQNLIFYKLNVLDDKLFTLFKLKDVEKVQECIIQMDKIIKESEFKTEDCKGQFDDESLNNRTIDLIKFFQNQNTFISKLYFDYIREFDILQIEKKIVPIDADEETIAAFNLKVKSFNVAKNLFFDALYENQLAKKKLLDSWYVTNSTFLKNNIVFEDVYENFIKSNK
jgi:hypothetical protein